MGALRDAPVLEGLACPILRLDPDRIVVLGGDAAVAEGLEADLATLLLR